MIAALATLAPPEVAPDDAALVLRISAEFLEMPDLKVTLAQASRLFAVEPPRCRRILHLLVAGGVLSIDGDSFARAGTGRRPA